MYHLLPEHDLAMSGATFTIRDGAQIVGHRRVKRVSMPEDAEFWTLGGTTRQTENPLARQR